MLRPPLAMALPSLLSRQLGVCNLAIQQGSCRRCVVLQITLYFEALKLSLPLDRHGVDMHIAQGMLNVVPQPSMK